MKMVLENPLSLPPPALQLYAAAMNARAASGQNNGNNNSGVPPPWAPLLHHFPAAAASLFAAGIGGGGGAAGMFGPLRGMLPGGAGSLGHNRAGAVLAAGAYHQQMLAASRMHTAPGPPSEDSGSETHCPRGRNL